MKRDAVTASQLCRLADDSEENLKAKTSPLVEFSSVTKRYGAHEALKDVSFLAHAREFVAVVGPNGAGKSTLVELLAGLIVPDQGEIQIAGSRMRLDSARALSSIGFVFQETSLDLELSVERNLRFHAGLHGMDHATAEIRIREVLECFDLAARSSDAARSLSGGNRRRLELARALLPGPSILIMDEPTVGLDPQMRGELVEHVHQLAREDGLLILWTTHLMEEAEDADRLLVLHEGRVQFDGDPANADGAILGARHRSNASTDSSS